MLPFFERLTEIHSNPPKLYYNGFNPVRLTVESHYNENVRTMKITLLYQG